MGISNKIFRKILLQHTDLPVLVVYLENGTVYIIFVSLCFFTEMNPTEDGKGICECFQSKLIKWEKLKVCSNFFYKREIFCKHSIYFLSSTFWWKQKMKRLVWGKLSENSDCHSGSFLEADYNIAALGLFRCSFNTVRSIKTLEVLVGLQGVWDSESAWSFQGLDQPLKFLP